MIDQVQCGDAVKKVSDTLIHPPLPEAHDAQERHQGGAHGRQRGAREEVPRRELGVARQTVHLGLVRNEIERVQAAEHRLVGAIQPGARLPQHVQLLHPPLSPLLELADRPELNGLSGTRLCAGGHHTRLEPVVAQRALLRRSRCVVDVDHAERARGDAHTATVAHVRLNHDGVELGADDRAGGTHFEAGGAHAMLAHIAHHEPASAAAILAELLDELDVTPVDAVEPPGVVVTVARQLAPAPVGGGELVPLFARHLARLAPDAHGSVGVEPHGFGHQAFSTLHTNAFPSWMLTLGSPTSAVRWFTTSPVTTPSQPQCHGMPTWCTTLPAMRNGRSRRVTSALARISARGVAINTQSRLWIPFSVASSGESSMNSSGCSSVSQGFHRLIAPAT